MLFRKKIERSCLYCVHGTKIDDDSVRCTKRGVVGADKKCFFFSYDPTKRVPPKPKAPDFQKYSEDDFTL